MIAYNINNGCYNCDIPCEKRVFRTLREEVMCYEMSKNQHVIVKDLIKDFVLTEKNKILIINTLDKLCK